MHTKEVKGILLRPDERKICLYVWTCGGTGQITQLGRDLASLWALGANVDETEIYWMTSMAVWDGHFLEKLILWSKPVGTKTVLFPISIGRFEHKGL